MAWTAGLATVGGGLLVALVGGALGAGLALRQEDRRLDDVIGNVAFELSHEAQGGDDAAAGRVGDDEQAEVAGTGIRVGIFRGGRHLGGAVATAPDALGCRTSRVGGEARRLCAMRVRSRSETAAASADDLVVAADSSLAPLSRWQRMWAGATGVALALLALLAAWSSRRAAAAAIAPLEQLRRAVAGVDPARPDPARVAAPSDSVEVEQIRGEFHALLERLTASLAQARRFAANVAHEWRTPLAALRGEVELLREDAAGAAAAPREMREALGRIEAQVVELGERLERVLVLARPEGDGGGGSVASRGEPVSLESVVREVVAALPPRDAARVVAGGGGEEEGLVSGDPALLRMMVRNAVDNALKHGGDGAVRVEVARAPGPFGAVTVTVADQGPGIAPDELARVFEPFYRGAAAVGARAPGMGLGLALVAHIARLHGGSARFDPVARGALLRVALPAWGAPKQG